MAKTIQDAFLNDRKIITEYARMWPRDVFDHPGSTGKFLADDLEILKHPGVYVLYRDDAPYYIGRTDGTLRGRLVNHAQKPTSRYDYFWNFFSVFIVPNKKDRAAIEALLIAAIPTANSAKPQAFERHKTDKAVISMIRKQRKHKATLGQSGQNNDKMDQRAFFLLT